MKHKYMLIKKDAEKELIIQEYSELDKDAYPCVYTETYSADTIRSALKQKDTIRLIDQIRTKSFFPTAYGIKKIIAGIGDLYASRDVESIEILIDDIEILNSIDRSAKTESEEKPVKIDELLEDDHDGAFDGDDLIDSIVAKSDDENEEDDIKEDEDE